MTGRRTFYLQINDFQDLMSNENDHKNTSTLHSNRIKKKLNHKFTEKYCIKLFSFLEVDI